MSDTLALFGGEKTIQKPFTRYNPIGIDEVEAATEVLKSGKLSPFIGAWLVDTEFGGFYGGKKVQTFERLVEERFKVRNAITVNSATSGLIAAVGAAGIEPGEEVIVSPWTMSASATAILWWNAIPVFADIESETFSLDPVSIEKNISSLTKAIIVPNIFGHPAELDTILEIAGRNNLIVIEDNAHGYLAKYKKKKSTARAHHSYWRKGLGFGWTPCRWSERFGKVRHPLSSWTKSSPSRGS